MFYYNIWIQYLSTPIYPDPVNVLLPRSRAYMSLPKFQYLSIPESWIPGVVAYIVPDSWTTYTSYPGICLTGARVSCPRVCFRFYIKQKTIITKRRTQNIPGQNCKQIRLVAL